MSAAAALIDGVGLYVHLAITSLGVVTNPLIIYVLCKKPVGCKYMPSSSLLPEPEAYSIKT